MTEHLAMPPLIDWLPMSAAKLLCFVLAVFLCTRQQFNIAHGFAVAETSLVEYLVAILLLEIMAFGWGQKAAVQLKITQMMCCANSSLVSGKEPRVFVILFLVIFSQHDLCS